MINDFHGNHFFLSNFYERPFWYRGRQWKTVEHAFQAAKCVNGADYDKIHAAATPGEAKRIGRKVTLIPNWDHERIKVMRNCLLMKFLQHDDLMDGLIETGDDELVEGNTWHDNDWGNCSCPKCAGKAGRNLLGELLMDLRDNYRNGNFIWVMRNSDGEITEHYKTRERALMAIKRLKYVGGIAAMMSNDATKSAMDDNPYEYDGYHLDVVCLLD